MADLPATWLRFGAELRRWRESRRLGVRELAAMIPLDHAAISRWENGLRAVSAEHARRLDDALNADGHLVAFHSLVSELDRLSTGTLGTEPSARHGDDVERRNLLQLLSMLGTEAALMPASTLDTLYKGLRQVTAEDSVDDWEQIAWDYAQGMWTDPPGSRAVDLASDIATLDQLLTRIQTPGDRVTLLRVYTQLAAFLAFDLATVASPRACWRGWRAARVAADASGDRDLAVWVRAAEGSRSFYARRPGPAALTLIEDAIRLADGTPRLGLAVALETRSQILADQGQDDHAREALKELGDVFERLPDTVANDRISAWGKPLADVLFTQAFVLTKLGDTKAAAPMLAQALALCPMEKAGGKANIGLIQAWGLVKDGEVTEGLAHAVDVIHPIPVTTARRRIAGEIIAALPDKAREIPAARQLRALTAS